MTEQKRLDETLNEYGVPEASFRCHTCDRIFTICPAPDPGDDDLYPDCLSPGCESYDPELDIGRLFDEGRVRVIENGDGTIRLVPFKVVGGKDHDPS